MIPARCVHGRVIEGSFFCPDCPGPRDRRTPGSGTVAAVCPACQYPDHELVDLIEDDCGLLVATVAECRRCGTVSYVDHT